MIKNSRRTVLRRSQELLQGFFPIESLVCGVLQTKHFKLALNSNNVEWFIIYDEYSGTSTFYLFQNRSLKHRIVVPLNRRLCVRQKGVNRKDVIGDVILYISWGLVSGRVKLLEHWGPRVKADDSWRRRTQGFHHSTW